MREIKFRAWDKIENKYVMLNKNMHHRDKGQGVPPSIYTTNDEMVFGLNSKFFYGRDIDLVYQQYTGLKDKNIEKHNEVYESDIIEFINGNKAVVEFDNYTGGWIARSIHKPMMKWNLVDSLLESALVIGNIYENPELLEQ